MPRPESPEGKWVTVPVRLRQSDVDRIEAVRGERNRSHWVRDAVRAVLSGEAPVVASAVAAEALPAGSAVQVSGADLVPVPAKPARKPRTRAAKRAGRPAGMAPTAAELARERADDAREGHPAPKTVTPAPEGVPAAAFQEPAEPALVPRQKAACKHPGVGRKQRCRECGQFNV